MRRRKHWGWGYEDDLWSAEQLRAAAPGLESSKIDVSEALRYWVAQVLGAIGRRHPAGDRGLAQGRI